MCSSTLKSIVSVCTPASTSEKEVVIGLIPFCKDYVSTTKYKIRKIGCQGPRDDTNTIKEFLALNFTLVNPQKIKIVDDVLRSVYA